VCAFRPEILDLGLFKVSENLFIFVSYPIFILFILDFILSCGVVQADAVQ